MKICVVCLRHFEKRPKEARSEFKIRLTCSPRCGHIKASAKQGGEFNSMFNRLMDRKEKKAS